MKRMTRIHIKIVRKILHSCKESDCLSLKSLLQGCKGSFFRHLEETRMACHMLVNKLQVRQFHLQKLCFACRMSCKTWQKTLQHDMLMSKMQTCISRIPKAWPCPHHPQSQLQQLCWCHLLVTHLLPCFRLCFDLCYLCFHLWHRGCSQPWIHPSRAPWPWR